MKLETIKPNIVRIAYHQEVGDPHYGSCLWAYFDFDIDRYMLNIQSDCGNAAYRWVETPKAESFLKLMARCDEGYMLGKLFVEERIDIDATVYNVREYVEIEKDQDELEYDLDDLRELLYDTSMEFGAVTKALNDWSDEHGYDLDISCERIATDYTAWQKRIISIFSDYVQPRIREILKADAEQAAE